MVSRAYRYYDLIMVSFVTVLLISNITSTKIVQLGPFTYDGGTILFPLSYIFGDILTEVYGYAHSRRVIWSGFFANAVMVLIFAIVGALPAAPGWNLQTSYDAILGMTPRIVIASLIAYWAGEFSNSYTLAKMKIKTRGKWLFVRTIGSTIVGQAVDTMLFVIIAFEGLYTHQLLLKIILSNYFFKVGVEIVATPLTYQIVGFLKRVEQEDYYDYETRFNPFLEFKINIKT